MNSKISLKERQLFICCSDEKSKEYPKLFEYIKEELNARDIDQFTSTEDTNIILLGGDGSINYLINKIDDFTKSNILYLTCGTANDFSKSLKLSKSLPEPDQLLDILSNASTIKVPIMKCNEMRFINVVTAGALAEVTNSGSDMLKKVSGKISYYLSSVEKVFNLDPFNFTVKFNDKVEKEFDTYGFIISQGLYAGGGVKCNTSIVPNFKENFEFLTINDLNLGECFTSILSLQDSNLIYKNDDKKVWYKKNSETVEISSDTTIPLKLDGEEYESKKCVFQKDNMTINFYQY